jgi:ribosomal protein S14
LSASHEILLVHQEDHMKKPKKKNDAKLPLRPKKSEKPEKHSKTCGECGRPKGPVGQDEEE